MTEDTVMDKLSWIMYVKVKSLSRVRLFATPWTVAYQASLSMGFSRQEYWSGLPFPSPGDVPNPGIEPGSSALEADALTSEPPGKPMQTQGNHEVLRRKQDGLKETEETWGWRQVGMMSFEDGGRGHEPRQAGNL